MNPYTYLIAALCIIYLISYTTKKVAKFIIYLFFVFFLAYFIIEFLIIFYGKLTTHTPDDDDDY